MALGYVKKMQTEKKLGVASRLLGCSLPKSRETASAREDGERREPSRTAGGCPPVWPLRDTGWRCPQKLRAELSCDPAIPFLGIYPKETPTKPKDSGFGGDSEALCALKRGNTPPMGLGLSSSFGEDVCGVTSTCWRLGKPSVLCSQDKFGE